MNPEEIRAQSGESTRQDPHKDSMDVLDLFITLCRGWKLILVFTIAATLLAAIAVMLIPSQYTADTLVLPPTQSVAINAAIFNELAGSAALASANGANAGMKNMSAMFVALFRTRTVEDAVVQRFGLMARYNVKRITDARAAFEQHSTVALDAKDGLIRISVRDLDPKVAADIANGYVDEFRKFSIELAISDASQRRAFFQQQLTDADSSLKSAQAALQTSIEDAHSSTGKLPGDAQARALIDSAAVLGAQITVKELELESMHAYATDFNPGVIQIKDQLTAFKAQLTVLSGAGDSSNGDMIVPKGKVPAADMEYLRKLRDVKYYATIKELLARQFETAKQDEARQGAVIQVADPAAPPDARSAPNRKAIVLAAAVFGFVVACFLSVLAEEIRRMRDDPVERQRLQSLRAAFRGTV